MKTSISLYLCLALAMGLVLGTSAQSANCTIKFFNAIAAGRPLDLIVNGQVVAPGIAFGQQRVAQIPCQNSTVGVAPTGGNETLLEEAAIPLVSGQAVINYIVAAGIVAAPGTPASPASAARLLKANLTVTPLTNGSVSVSFWHVNTATPGPLALSFFVNDTSLNTSVPLFQRIPNAVLPGIAGARLLLANATAQVLNSTVDLRSVANQSVTLFFAGGQLLLQVDQLPASPSAASGPNRRQAPPLDGATPGSGASSIGSAPPLDGATPGSGASSFGSAPVPQPEPPMPTPTLAPEPPKPTPTLAPEPPKPTPPPIPMAPSSASSESSMAPPPAAAATSGASPRAMAFWLL